MSPEPRTLPPCPRCAGFVYLEYGELHCLNCGWEPPTPNPLPRRPRERSSEWRKL